MKCCPVPSTSMTYAPTEFEDTTSKGLHGLGGDALTRTFNICLLALTKVTRNVAKYPLHHVTYSATKLEVATSNRLGGDTFTRNVTDAQPHGRTDVRTHR